MKIKNIDLQEWDMHEIIHTINYLITEVKYLKKQSEFQSKKIREKETYNTFKNVEFKDDFAEAYKQKRNKTLKKYKGEK